MQTGLKFDLKVDKKKRKQFHERVDNISGTRVSLYVGIYEYSVYFLKYNECVMTN